MDWSFLASPIVGLAGSLFGGHSAKKQQERAFKYQLSLWKYQQSNAHQLEVQDLQKAGLNPILSATGGQMASGGSAPIAQDPYNFSELGNYIGNALRMNLDSQRLENEKKKIELQALETNARVNQSNANVKLLENQGVESAWRSDLLSKQSQNLDREIFERIDLYPIRKALLEGERDKALAMIDNIGASTYELGTRAGLNVVTTALKEKEYKFGAYISSIMPLAFSKEFENDPSGTLRKWSKQIAEEVAKHKDDLAPSALKAYEEIKDYITGVNGRYTNIKNSITGETGGYFGE